MQQNILRKLRNICSNCISILSWFQQRTYTIYTGRVNSLFLWFGLVLGSFLVQVLYLGGFEERSQICFLVSWDSHIIDRLGDSVLKMIGLFFLILKLTFFDILKLKFLKYLKLTSLEIDKAEIANSPWFEADVGQRCLIGWAKAKKKKNYQSAAMTNYQAVLKSVHVVQQFELIHGEMGYLGTKKTCTNFEPKGVLKDV